MKRKNFIEKIKGYQFVILALVVFGTFIVYPLIDVFRSSLFKINTLSQVEIFIKFENYIKLFQNHVFIRALLNTFIYTASIIVLINVLAIIFAIIFDRGKIVGNYFLRVVFFIPVILAPVLIGVTFKRIFAVKGALNLILEKTGLEFLTRNWLAISWLALFVVIVTTVWWGTGWNMMLYYARLREISRDLYEAAAIDGASEVGIIKYIKLPLMRTTMAILVVINIIGGAKVFDLIYVMTRGGPAQKTEVLTTYLFYQAFKFYKWGYASSVSVILFIIVMFFTWLRVRSILKD